MLKKVLYLVGLIALTACAKVHDLDAPCREFGRYCSQQPINVEPLEKNQGENQ